MTFFTDAELDDLYERSKLDTEIIVGSEIRVLIGEIRHHRQSTTTAELQLFYDLRTAADQMALAQWRAARPTASDQYIPEHADLVIWLLDQLAGINRIERTDAGVIDWRMEADRANRLLDSWEQKGKEFEIVRRASHLFEEAANCWMERASKAETALAQNERLDRVDTALAKQLQRAIERNVQLHEQIAEACREIEQWSKAYPLQAFPEPDLTKAAKLLKAGGETLDAVSASNIRHVLNRVTEIMGLIGKAES